MQNKLFLNHRNFGNFTVKNICESDNINYVIRILFNTANYNQIPTFISYNYSATPFLW